MKKVIFFSTEIDIDNSVNHRGKIEIAQKTKREPELFLKHTYINKILEKMYGMN